MNCNPQSLMEQAKCFRCIPSGNVPSVISYLMCQWSNKPHAPPFTFVPTDIPCLETWFKLETLDGMYNDGDPIGTWPPGFGVKNLIAYDPNATGISPLFEANAGPTPGGPDANLAPGGAFTYPNPPYPLEVFMVGFQNAVAMGATTAHIVDCFNGASTFESHILVNIQVDMDLGIQSVSDVNVAAIEGIWTSYDFCMAGASSYMQIGPNPNVLVPANPGANLPGPELIIGNQVGWDGLNNPDTRWGGSIADVLIFSCVLTTQQRANLRTYFKNKFSGMV